MTQHTYTVDIIGTDPRTGYVTCFVSSDVLSSRSSAHSWAQSQLAPNPENGAVVKEWSGPWEGVTSPEMYPTLLTTETLAIDSETGRLHEGWGPMQTMASLGLPDLKQGDIDIDLLQHALQRMEFNTNLTPIDMRDGR